MKTRKKAKCVPTSHCSLPSTWAVVSGSTRNPLLTFTVVQ